MGALHASPCLYTSSVHDWYIVSSTGMSLNMPYIFTLNVHASFQEPSWIFPTLLAHFSFEGSTYFSTTHLELNYHLSVLSLEK